MYIVKQALTHRNALILQSCNTYFSQAQAASPNGTSRTHLSSRLGLLLHLICRELGERILQFINRHGKEPDKSLIRRFVRCPRVRAVYEVLLHSGAFTLESLPSGDELLGSLEGFGCFPAASIAENWLQERKIFLLFAIVVLVQMFHDLGDGLVILSRARGEGL